MQTGDGKSFNRAPSPRTFPLSSDVCQGERAEKKPPGEHAGRLFVCAGEGQRGRGASSISSIRCLIVTIRSDTSCNSRMIVACLGSRRGDSWAISTAFRANSGSAMKSAKNALPVSIHCCSASIVGLPLYMAYCSALYCVTQVPISRLCSDIMDKMTFAKPFGDMLKEKRKLRGLSQTELAIKSGRSLRCIQYLEAGTQEPTLSTLYALAHALDFRVTDLIEALPEELNDMYG